ncbi:MAG: CAP domain-containing protein [Pseudomonadota bacterium]
MSIASDAERYMLGLINEERTSRGLVALQLERNLNESSEEHSEWSLRTNTFSHTGAGGSSATQRMREAGFDFSGSWRSAENIAIRTEGGAPGIQDDVQRLHQQLMDSPGHRANILNPDLRYIGIGVETGDFTYDSGYRGESVMVTQNFAATRGDVDLDAGPANTAPTTPPADPAPAPQPPAPSGPTAGNDALNGTSAGEHIKGDAGNDTISGKAGNDTLGGGTGNDNLQGDDGNDRLIGWDGNDRLEGGGGNDRLIAGKGNDVAAGGSGSDVLFGEAGSDRVYGGDGNDKLLGGTENDTLDGGNGNDNVHGQQGNDVVSGGAGQDSVRGGGGNDTLEGGTGNDMLVGHAGADRFIFKNGFDRDTIMDFDANNNAEKLDFSGVSSVTSFNDLMQNHASQQGSNVVIDAGSGDVLTLRHVGLSDLDSADFLF